MRIVFALLAASCLATPALARDREPPVVERLNDPLVQEGVTAAVGAIADIVLDTRIGGLARLSDGRIDPRDTLRDLKRREDPGFERRLRRDTREAVGTAGAVAGDMASTAAALGDTVARLQAALGPLARYATSSMSRDDGYYDDGDDY